jgi:hypothetical protein
MLVALQLKLEGLQKSNGVPRRHGFHWAVGWARRDFGGREGLPMRMLLFLG